MRLLPEGIDEMSANFRWGVEWRLRMIEDVVCAPQGSRPGGPGMEESMERARRAAQRGDREVEDAAFLDGMRAEVREGWKDFPERQLLGDLFRRAALRRKGRPRDKIARHNSRRPTYDEGLRVAKALLADIAATARFDFAWESEAVSIVLADHGPLSIASAAGPRCRSTSTTPTPARSTSTRSHASRRSFVAGASPSPAPSPGGGRRLPAGACSVPPGSPSHPIAPPNRRGAREVDIRFAIEVLRSVGVPPMGTPVSGCGFVAAALNIPEDTVTRIWKTSFELMMRQQMKATAERTGPFHTH